MINQENPWILTASGKAFDLAEPTADMVDALDIANSLSKIVRWNGHQNDGANGPGISVAEHSVRVAEVVQKTPAVRFYGQPFSRRTLTLAALLHDAHEAYLGDISSPVKNLIGRRIVEACERRIDAAIEEHFGLDSELMRHPIIKRADEILLATEGRDLMPPSPRPYLPDGPLEQVIWPWHPMSARERFLDMLKSLT